MSSLFYCSYKIKKKLFRVFMYFILCISITLMLFPFIIIVFSSLMSEHELYLNHYPNFHLFPNEWNSFVDLFKNYKSILISSGRMIETFINSLKIAVPTTFLTTGISVFAAYPLSRTTMKGRNTILFLFLFASIVPTMAILIPLYIQFVKVGLYDTFVGLIIVLVAYTLPFTIWIMKAFFDTIPRTLEDAALVDGCTRVKTLLKVIMPLAMPGIGTVAVYTFIVSWSNFLIGLILTRKDALPFTVYIGVFSNMENLELTKILAAGVVSSLPVVILALIFQKLIVKGLVAGAMKG